jgi:Flp pilus assembly protein TadD
VGRHAILDRLAAAAEQVLARRPRDEAARAVRWAVTLERSAELPRPDARVLVLLGVLAAREGRLADARRWNETALRESPDEPAALNNLAWVLARSGAAADRALDLARRAVATDPKNPEYRDTLATALASVAPERR